MVSTGGSGCEGEETGDSNGRGDDGGGDDGQGNVVRAVMVVMAGGRSDDNDVGDMTNDIGDRNDDCGDGNVCR